MPPLISVIIPVYNGQKYIERCLTAIQRQTYTNLEIIVVNNASTDNTLSLCTTIAQKDPRIKIYNTTIKGVSNARNLGLDKAQGQYIGFVDADDYIELDMYEYLYKLLMEYRADISSCNIHYAASNKIFTVNEQISIGFDSFKQCVLNNGIFVAVWNKLYSKQAIGDVRFPDIQTSEDFKFLYDIFKNPTRLVCGKQVKYHYEVSTYKSFSDRDLDSIAVMQQILESLTSKEKAKFSLLQYAYLKQLFAVYMKCVLDNKISLYPQLNIKARECYFSFITCPTISFKFKAFIVLVTMNKNLAKWVLKKLK